MAFTETWLTPAGMETDLTLSSFGAPVRLERKADVTVKSQGEGSLSVFISVCARASLSESLRALPKWSYCLYRCSSFICPTYLLLLSTYTKNAVNTLNKVTHKLPLS